MTRVGRKPTIDAVTKERIRKAYAQGVDQSSLAERFGTTQSYISFIVNNKESEHAST